MEKNICEHKKYTVISEIKDVKIGKCQNCELVFAAKGHPVDLDKIYQNFYNQETASRFNFWMEATVKAFRFWRAVKIARLKPEAKSILDIGSGRGWMLYFLRKYFRYETTVGTQISRAAYEFSRNKLKLEIYPQDLLDINWDKKFDLITLWHVLEHVESPEAYLQKIRGLLQEGGRLIIEVPNYNSWSSILTKNHWLALDLKHHLTFFTPATLVELLHKYDFKIKRLRTFSLEYSAFTSTQSLINWLTGTDNYFFEWLQKGGFNSRQTCLADRRGRASSSVYNPELTERIEPRACSGASDYYFKIILHGGLFIILFPACLAINLILYFSKRGEVINIVAQKNDE